MKRAELRKMIHQVTQGAKLIIASNREPVMHERDADGITAVRPASGMVTALEPIIMATGGTWVAHGSGSADRLVVDAGNRIGIPEGKPKYTLKRVWLTRKEEEGYYYGISNRALWPLCHITYTRPQFTRSEWEIYKDVNMKFCESVLEEAAGGQAIVFVQDYQLSLLPRYLKNARPDLNVIQFWHIPWPNKEAFRIFPWGEELLDGLLGNDILGFHIKYHCNNFLDTVDRGIEAKVDYEQFRIFRGGTPTYVRHFPISVDFKQIGRDSQSPYVRKVKETFSKELGHNTTDVKLFVGADRIDYTKGIPERLKGFDLMLRQHPELCTQVTLVQLAAPSRTHIEAYRNLNDQIDNLVDEINWHHQTEDWVPVRFLRSQHDYYSVLAAYQLADVVLVTSLHDGMNLVAKEYLSSRTDGDGVLILSKYTGAARQLTQALLINPFDVDEIADAMLAAFNMPPEERKQRMSIMREHLENNTVYDWGRKIFKEFKKNIVLKDNTQC